MYKGVNAKYRALQGTFFVFFCMVFGFNTYYLGSAGFSNGMIGILISLACIMGGITQAAGGRLADRHPKFNWKRQTVIIMAAELVLSLLLIPARGSMATTGALFFLMMMIGLTGMPMVNTAAFYYIDRGIPVNYGIARGIGSATFGIASFITGELSVAMGDGVVPIVSAASAGATLVLAMSLPLAGGEVKAAEEPGPAKKESTSDRRNFYARYPELTLVAIGIFMILILHNAITTYLIRIVESVGGNSGDMGIALGIAAVIELPILFIYTRLSSATGISSGSFITIGGACYVIRGLLYVAAGSVAAIFMIQFLQSVSFALILAAKANYANETVDTSDQAMGQSLMAMTDSLGAVGGSLVGGLLLDYAGVNAMLLAASACAAVGTALTFAARRRKTNNR